MSHDDDQKSALRDAAAYVRWLGDMGFVVAESSIRSQMPDQPAASAARRSEVVAPKAAAKAAPKSSGQTATPDIVLKGPPDSPKRAQLAELFGTVSACHK